MKKQNTFSKWFNTFLEEKCVDMSEYVNNGDLQVGDVCSMIHRTTKEEQKNIKNTIVMIDFKNGNVVDYFRHLAQALDSTKVKKELANDLFGN